jgi:hypothetical protein
MARAWSCMVRAWLEHGDNEYPGRAGHRSGTTGCHRQLMSTPGLDILQWWLHWLGTMQPHLQKKSWRNTTKGISDFNGGKSRGGLKYLY